MAGEQKTGAQQKAGTKKTATKKTGSKKTGENKKTLTITLMVSPIGFNEKQGLVVQGMGLRRIRHSVTLQDTPETRGMIHKVRHLVEVSE